MKKISILALLVLLSASVFAQTKKDKEIIAESKEAKKTFLKTDKGMDTFFSSSYGYVMFHTEKSQPHKMHIWFLPTQKPTRKKTKRVKFCQHTKKR